jgi:hypothetical protein
MLAVSQCGSIRMSWQRGHSRLAGAVAILFRRQACSMKFTRSRRESQQPSNHRACRVHSRFLLVMPAQAGIQYPALYSRFPRSHRADSGSKGSPLSGNAPLAFRIALARSMLYTLGGWRIDSARRSLPRVTPPTTARLPDLPGAPH